MDTIDLIKALFDSGPINNSVDRLTEYIVVVCSTVIPVFYCISWVWNIAKTTVTNLGTRPKFFEPVVFIRGALLWMLVMNYQIVFGAIESLAFQVIAATEPNNYAQWKANHGALTVQILSPESKLVRLDPSSGSSDDPVQGMGDSSFIPSPEELVNAFISGAFAILGYIASILAGGISYLLSKIFYVIGPLAITFSILPVFKDKLDKWFSVWLGVTMNLLTLNLLTTILVSVTMESIEAMGTSVVSGTAIPTGNLSMIFFNAIIFILYALSFWITGYMVGNSDAGKVLSTGVAAGTSLLAYGAMKGDSVSTGGTGTGPSTSVVPNVLSATRDTK